jgi:hypothetical protein
VWVGVQVPQLPPQPSLPHTRPVHWGTQLASGGLHKVASVADAAQHPLKQANPEGHSVPLVQLK